jgi:hypothetical protein
VVNDASRAPPATPQVGPHCAATRFFEVAKTTGMCSPLGDAKESYTELCDVGTLEGDSRESIA